jgi:hypothetical protein
MLYVQSICFECITKIQLTPCTITCKSKAIPVTGRGGLQGYEMLRISHYLNNRLKHGVKVVSPTHRPRSAPQKYYFSASGTHFC